MRERRNESAGSFSWDLVSQASSHRRSTRFRNSKDSEHTTYVYICMCVFTYIHIYIYVFTYIHIQTTLLESSRFAENTFTLVSRSYSVRSSPIGRWIAVDREIDQQLPSGSLTGILRSNLNLSSRLNYSQGYDNYSPGEQAAERERE